MNCAAQCFEQNITENGFMQYVFDNADINVTTLDGHGTFHALGGIQCVTPHEAVVIDTTIARQPTLRIDSENKNIRIQIYKKSATDPLKNVVVKSIDLSYAGYVKKALKFDLIWLAGFITLPQTPSWNGYMNRSFSETGEYILTIFERVFK